MSENVKFQPQRVLVLSINGNDLGLGTYVADEPIEEWDMTTPKIELDSGRTIYGYECWWTAAELEG